MQELFSSSYFEVILLIAMGRRDWFVTKNLVPCKIGLARPNIAIIYCPPQSLTVPQRSKLSCEWGGWTNRLRTFHYWESLSLPVKYHPNTTKNEKNNRRKASKLCVEWGPGNCCFSMTRQLNPMKHYFHRLLRNKRRIVTLEKECALGMPTPYIIDIHILYCSFLFLCVFYFCKHFFCYDIFETYYVEY